MKSLQEKLSVVENHVKEDRVRVMIIGLGSVGSYLLDYLLSRNDSSMDVVVVGRDFDKMQTKVNITRIAGLIRGVNRSKVYIEAGVDLDNIDLISETIDKYKPDFIVNSSRAYSGLKYGSISWTNLRAYGIWTPLAIKYTKNIMDACEKCDTDAVVINTSYSDAVIPWLKSAGKAYPDFGSGNLNHLVPRIKYAVAEFLGADDFWNVNVMFAAGHFHDVCISKEGQTEGVDLPLKIYYRDQEVDIPHQQIYSACKIAMPTDQTRNMMNASSNYQIIDSIINTVQTGKSNRLFIPGFDGNIGGYPVVIGYREGSLSAWIDESMFSFDYMLRANRESMFLDGIESISEGQLVYTDALIEKTRIALSADLPKEVSFDDIDQTAKFIIDKIITPKIGNGKV